MTGKLTPEKAAVERILKLRKAVKVRKPSFRRHESWRYNRLKESWRKPRGLDNKMRLKAKGWPKSVNIGYRGPKTARGLHPSGYYEVLVHTPDEIAEVDPKTHAIRIARNVGTRKRIQIASLARKREIHVLNPLVKIGVEEETLEEEIISEPEETKIETKTKIRKKPKRAQRSKRAKEVRSK